MSLVTVEVSFDQPKGQVKFAFDLQGRTEIEHELLNAAIAGGRSVSIVPTHKGDELFAEFTITDPSIFTNASRGLENRKRVADGRPTVEEEEAQVAIREAAEQDSAKAEAVAAKKAADEAAAKQTAEDKRLADAVAAGVAKAMSQK